MGRYLQPLTLRTGMYREDYWAGIVIHHSVVPDCDAGQQPHPPGTFLALIDHTLNL